MFIKHTYGEVENDIIYIYLKNKLHQSWNSYLRSQNQSMRTVKRINWKGKKEKNQHIGRAYLFEEKIKEEITAHIQCQKNPYKVNMKFALLL